MFSCVKHFSNLVGLNQQLSELDLNTRNLVLFAEKDTVAIISGVTAKMNKPKASDSLCSL